MKTIATEREEYDKIYITTSSFLGFLETGFAKNLWMTDCELLLKLD